MTASSPLADARPADATARAPWLRPDRWHRPLVGLALAMAALTIVTAVLAIVDPREILGQNAWFKPMKFALSIGLYALTLAWLIAQVRRRRRLADALGTVAVVGLVIEIVIIAGAAAVGTTSHFNVATPLNTSLWTVMAISITVVWLATLVLGVVVALNPGPDAARNLAVRSGVVLGLIGMALAFLMTGPQPHQLDDFQGIAGAHAVGVADGGPGLPFLGWSTEGGDLRIPHFVGLHALQAIPLGALALEALSRRIRALRDPRVRLRLVGIGAVAFAAFLAILTWQALIGEPIVAPSAPVVVASTVTAVASLGAAAAVLALDRVPRASRRREDARM
ncbi:hypothetical protein [Microbacterium album]|uniref:Uncharacterized protein n=1 Tax=Microbacterium album TaxID=2053191 RepID=A0A917II60_9MICO|nr:hypothetical protein [Microbacterium album]GGH48804.1 hypothetical protein GCM10010921_26540 [Microbacterium album]